MKLAIIYSILAAIATFANIAAQDLTLRLVVGNQALLLSVIVGTLVGLIIKYILDKRYIFTFRAQNLSEDGRLFLLYGCMGVLTTLIFWSFEFGFHYLFQTDAMRYLGGVIGLAIGYFIKYRLDKRYVFKCCRVDGQPA